MLHGFAVERERRWRQGKNSAVISVWQDIGKRVGGRQMGIAAQVTFRDHLVPNRDGVPRKKSVTPIITGHAKLAATGDGFNLPGVGPESKIVPAQRDRLR